MGGNPVIRFPSPAADETIGVRVRNHAPETQRRIIRQPVPLPLPHSQRPPSQAGRQGTGMPSAETRSDLNAAGLSATNASVGLQPCRRAHPATRGAFELDVSADFYATKANDLPPALFGYWLPRTLQNSLARRNGDSPSGPEILGYDDPANHPPPSILGYWRFHRPPVAPGS